MALKKFFFLQSTCTCLHFVFALVLADLMIGFLLDVVHVLCEHTDQSLLFAALFKEKEKLIQQRVWQPVTAEMPRPVCRRRFFLI